MIFLCYLVDITVLLRQSFMLFYFVILIYKPQQPLLRAFTSLLTAIMNIIKDLQTYFILHCQFKPCSMYRNYFACFSAL